MSQGRFDKSTKLYFLGPFGFYLVGKFESHTAAKLFACNHCNGALWALPET